MRPLAGMQSSTVQGPWSQFELKVETQHPFLFRCWLQVGHDRLQSAFTSMMNEDGKADELLDQAMDKFEVR